MLLLVLTSTYLQKRKKLAKWGGMTSHISLSFLDFGIFPCSTVRHLIVSLSNCIKYLVLVFVTWLLPKVYICNLTFSLQSVDTANATYVRPPTLSDVPKSIQHFLRVKPCDLWIVIDHASFNGNRPFYSCHILPL